MSEFNGLLSINHFLLINATDKCKLVEINVEFNPISVPIEVPLLKLIHNYVYL